MGPPPAAGRDRVWQSAGGDLGKAGYIPTVTRDYRSIVSDNHRWEQFTHRPGDIFVCTPPKCGTTWMQTIVVTLLFPAGDAPGPVVEIAPWIDARFYPIDELITRLDAQEHRRSIKTHTPADGIPWHPDASYIVVGRDGRDAFMSFVNHLRNMRPDRVGDLAGSAIEEGIELGEMPALDDEHAFFAQWLEGGDLFHHIDTFWAHHGEPNVLFAHYDDMTADLEGEMRRVAAFLELDIDEDLWPAMVERCTFASMKARPDEIGPFDQLFVGGADSFLYKGTNGRWRDVLTADEVAAYDRRVAELLPPDAVTWLAGRTEAVPSPT
jgi:aryl sulfotransferase